MIHFVMFLQIANSLMMDGAKKRLTFKLMRPLMAIILVSIRMGIKAVIDYKGGASSD